MANDSRTPQPEADDGISRRTVIRSVAVAGAVAAAGVGLAACGGDDGGAASSGSASDAPVTSDPPVTSDAPVTSEPPTTGGGGKALAKTSEVPVGGGKVIKKKWVVTQPAKGQFKGFSAICTHQGCPVSEVVDGTIKCPCHGSAFSAEDGSVKNGPAQSPLESIAVKVEGDSIVQA